MHVFIRSIVRFNWMSVPLTASSHQWVIIKVTNFHPSSLLARPRIFQMHMIMKWWIIHASTNPVDRHHDEISIPHPLNPITRKHMTPIKTDCILCMHNMKFTIYIPYCVCVSAYAICIGNANGLISFPFIWYRQCFVFSSVSISRLIVLFLLFFIVHFFSGQLSNRIGVPG